MSELKWTVSDPEPQVPHAARFDLPYCLHLQNGRYDVRLGDRLYHVELEKRWRNSEGCSDEDSVHDELRYLDGVSLTTGRVGGDPEQATKLVGTNTELIEDPTGRFRYSRVIVPLTTPAGSEPDPFDDLFIEALEVVNRLVDVFRFASGRAYLPPVRIEDVEFIETQNLLTGEGAFTMSPGRQGFGAAVINETASVHTQVRKMLAEEVQVPLHSELLLSAKREAVSGGRRQAVIDAIAALEVLVDELVERRLLASESMSSGDFEELLRTDGRILSDRMKKPLQLAIGWRGSSNPQLWERWLRANSIRRAAVHLGVHPNDEQVAEVLEVIEALAAEIETRDRGS